MTALFDYREWLKAPGGDIDEMWSNGADFDNVVLRNAYEAIELECPWGFRSSRCFRTLKMLGVDPGENISRVTEHNALDDAKVQAYYAIAYLRKIRLGQVALNKSEVRPLKVSMNQFGSFSG